MSTRPISAAAGLHVEALDVTDDAGVTAFAKKHTRADALVNCADILARNKEFEIDTFKKVLDVNLPGTFRMCLAFQRRQSQSKGVVVNIESMNATPASPRIPTLLRQQAREASRC